MKTKSTSSTLLFLLLVIASAFLLSDCVFKKKNTNKQSSFVEKQQIEVNKQDAKLLVEITKVNLNLIELCENIEKSKLNDKIKEVSKKVQSNQLSINESLNQLATQKLISLPDVLFNPFHSNSTNVLSILNEENFIATAVQEIKEEMKLLDDLEINTTDIDIKVLAIQSKTKLNLSLIQLEYAVTNTNI
ncbi:hypothetical protein [Flavobacterium sp.]|uniref:hypothetical protein n=1 Tax=Flavobacterium sp. TaxID=239 RepID=UPI002B4B4A90|nr:hypothetical protein [Flavobacterium sp.]HLP63858.1 hypothetical protein [Flavobacterium sp.]